MILPQFQLFARSGPQEQEAPMAAEVSQSYQTHRRWVPLYHFVTIPIVTLNLLWSLYRMVRAVRFHGRFDIVDSLVGVLAAIALALIAFFARSFALAAQDRIIRHEMRTRLAALLPPDLEPRIAELSPGQLIAMRFASDAELPELTRRVLDERIAGREAIKKLVRSWQADHFRI
jgi:hypothetical protein